MLTPPYESFRRQLVEDGFTPQYARRFAGELADHFETLRARLISSGLDPGAAEAIARRRIGTDEAILDRARATNRYRSFSRRRPVWCFIIAPLLLMIVTAFSFAIAVAIVAEFIELGPASPAPLLSYFATRILLPLTATLFVLAWSEHARRRRCPWRWPLFSCALQTALCATVVILVLSPNSTSPGTIAIGIGPPPQNWLMVLPLTAFLAYTLIVRLLARRQASAGDAETAPLIEEDTPCLN